MLSLYFSLFRVFASRIFSLHAFGWALRLGMITHKKKTYEHTRHGLFEREISHVGLRWLIFDSFSSLVRCAFTYQDMLVLYMVLCLSNCHCLQDIRFLGYTDAFFALYPFHKPNCMCHSSPIVLRHCWCHFAGSLPYRSYCPIILEKFKVRNVHRAFSLIYIIDYFILD